MGIVGRRINLLVVTAVRLCICSIVTKSSWITIISLTVVVVRTWRYMMSVVKATSTLSGCALSVESRMEPGMLRGVETIRLWAHRVVWAGSPAVLLAAVRNVESVQGVLALLLIGSVLILRVLRTTVVGLITVGSRISGIYECQKLSLICGTIAAEDNLAGIGHTLVGIWLRIAVAGISVVVIHLGFFGKKDSGWKERHSGVRNWKRKVIEEQGYDI